MWFEILPGVAIMAVCLSIPGVATAYIHKFSHGRKENKDCSFALSLEFVGKRHISRVNRHYVTSGLENID